MQNYVEQSNAMETLTIEEFTGFRPSGLDVGMLFFFGNQASLNPKP